MYDQQSWHPDAFLQNRYTRAYRRLIEWAKFQNRKREKCQHAEHHIVPKSFYRSYCEDGWLDGDWDAPENRVLLTHREHTQCHIWLWERMTEGLAKRKMALAVKRTLNHRAYQNRPFHVTVDKLTLIMKESAEASSLAIMGDRNPRYDAIIRDWAHIDGRVFTGTRSELEIWAGLNRGSLSRLTNPNNKLKLRYGWYIVVPDEGAPQSRHIRSSLAQRGRTKLSALDVIVRDWEHLDGRIFTGTRSELEKWAGLNSGSLYVLTQQKNPRKIARGWTIK